MTRAPPVPIGEFPKLRLELREEKKSPVYHSCNIDRKQAKNKRFLYNITTTKTTKNHWGRL